MAAAPTKDSKEPKLDGSKVATFEAYDRASGEKIVVDHRTYDEELHSLKEVKVKPSKTDPAK
jgi:hypothetical protein